MPTQIMTTQELLDYVKKEDTMVDASVSYGKGLVGHHSLLYVDADVYTHWGIDDIEHEMTREAFLKDYGHATWRVELTENND